MFGIGPTELIVILVIALLVLGPKRLPDLASGLGKGLAEFRRATRDINAELDEARRTVDEEAKAISRATEPERRVSRSSRVPHRAAAATPSTDDGDDDDDDDSPDSDEKS